MAASAKFSEVSSTSLRDHTDHTGHCGNDRGTHSPVEMATFQPPTVRTCDQMSSTQSGTTRKVMNFRIVLMPLFRSDTVFLLNLRPCGKFGRVTVLSYGGDFHQRHAGDGGGSRENIAAFALAYGP